MLSPSPLRAVPATEVTPSSSTPLRPFRPLDPPALPTGRGEQPEPGQPPLNAHRAAVRLAVVEPIGVAVLELLRCVRKVTAPDRVDDLGRNVSEIECEIGERSLLLRRHVREVRKR